MAKWPTSSIILVCGDTGAGKTYLTGTLAQHEHFRPVSHILLEPQAHLTLDAMEGGEYRTYRKDVKSVPALEEAVKNLKGARSVVIDSLWMLQDRDRFALWGVNTSSDVDAKTASKANFSPAMWGQTITHLQLILMSLAEMNVHVVVTCLVERIPDPLDLSAEPRQILAPALDTKLQYTIGAYFNHVGLCYRDYRSVMAKGGDEASYMVSFNHPSLRTKFSGAKVGAIPDPTFAKIFEMAYGAYTKGV